MERLSLYLHIPFCQKRCGYCDFNTYAGLDDMIPAYVDALEDEIAFYGARVNKKQETSIHTIFFGGGTPSLLSEVQMSQLLKTIRGAFQVIEGCEITIEANPGTVDLPFLKKIRELGVNRISLGVQSAIEAELATLDRQHGFPEARRAVSDARKAGFENISLDLIYGIPGQTVDTWQSSLDAALSLSPEHLSLYSLTVEPGTPLETKIAAGLLNAPEDDLAADLYDVASNKLAREGYRHYEISNWGRTRTGEILVSRHNLQYWRNLPYVGLGAGAHGFYDGVRYHNVAEIVGYIRGIGLGQGGERSPVSIDEEKIDRTREMNETMMMGLRLLEEGVSSRQFEARFGERLEEVFGQKIEKLISLGLLEWAKDNHILRLAERGYLLGNQVFGEFV